MSTGQMLTTPSFASYVSALYGVLARNVCTLAGTGGDSINPSGSLASEENKVDRVIAVPEDDTCESYSLMGYECCKLS